ncbi:MAG: molybdopterin-dependent oxidoreductase [Rhizorhabdus sp.]
MDMTTDIVTHTHCSICEQLCGITVTARDGAIVSIRPDKANPYTWRDFCVKAQRAGEVAASPARLMQPMRRVGDRFVPASYEEAIEDISTRLRTIVERDGPDAVGSYLGNPAGFNFGSAAFHSAFIAALGTHQTYAMNSIDNNAYHVAVDKIFDLEWLALVPDVDESDCFLFLGANPAVSKFNWLGKVPNGWRRVLDRVRQGADLIIVDPRRAESAEHATLYISPYPEEDWAFVLGMIQVILDEGMERLTDRVPVRHMEVLRALAAQVPLDQLAAWCDVPVEQIVDAARRFGRARTGFAFAATGPALGRNGTITHWLTMLLNVLTDRIDAPGGRFMPNWPMNFAVYKDRTSSTSKRPSRVRGLPPVVGNHSVSELADEILTPGEGRIRALFIDGGNLLQSGPGGHKMAQAFDDLELFVCVDLFQRETQNHAHWLIPGQHFLERSELHVGLNATNDRPYLQASRAAIPTPETIRPEWTFYRDLAAAMDIKLFGGRFEPHPDNVSRSLLELGDHGLTFEAICEAEHGLLFGERSMGHLWTYMREKGSAIDVAPQDFVTRIREEIAARTETPQRPKGSYRIISRRRNGMMNGWLAETSGSVTPDKTADYVEINAADAVANDIADGDTVIIRSDVASVTALAQLSDAVRSGVVVLAHGWGSPLFDPAGGEIVFQHGTQRNKLVSDTDIDPLSGVARFNGTPVTLARAS